MAGSPSFSASALTRAIRLLKAEGLTVTAVEILPDGTLRLSTRDGSITPVDADDEELARARAERLARKAQREAAKAVKPRETSPTKPRCALTDVEERIARNNAAGEATVKAIQDMEEQWLRDRVAGRPLTKYEVQIGRRIEMWPTEQSLGRLEAKLDKMLLARGEAVPSEKAERPPTRPKRP